MELCACTLVKICYSAFMNYLLALITSLAAIVLYVQHFSGFNFGFRPSILGEAILLTIIAFICAINYEKQ